MKNNLKKIPSVCLFLKLAYITNVKKFEGIMRYERSHDPWRIHITQEEYGVQDLEHYASELSGSIISFLPPPDVLDFLLKLNKPIVFLDTRQLTFPDYFKRYGYVYVNNRTISEMATEHFRSRGFQNVAYVHDYFSSVYSLERSDTLGTLAKQNGWGFSEYGRHTPFTVSEESRNDKRLANWLHTLPPSTGILTANDFRARQVLDICFTEGIDIPQDLAVLGVDNDSRICTISKPTLSSIEPNNEQGGYLAAQMLEKLMHGHRHNPKKILYYEPTGTVARRSTQTVKTPDPLVRAALEHIWERGWTGNVNSTARHLHISTRKLEIVFRKVIGHTVLEEIQNTRYRNIVHLLSTTDLGIAEITRQVGLKNPSNLIKKFKERYGVTMNQFRKRHRSE